MPDQTASPSGEMMLRVLDQAFDRRSWHGPNLRGSIRGVTARQAAWRPAAGRHSIAEQVLHAAYWKYVVRRKLTGEKRGSFALAGSNWFPMADRLTDADWKRMLAILVKEHGRLRAAVAAWTMRRSSEKTREFDLILGLAAHDVYHAGQISLLKRLSVSTSGVT